MVNISKKIVYFLHRQEFVIVSTLDVKGDIHCSVKGVVGIEEKGRVYLIDLYKARTFENLKNNLKITITAVDAHRFEGYALKGEGKIVEREKIKDHVIKDWEKKLVSRISKRVIRNIKRDKEGTIHPEIRFPGPEYLIEMDVKEIVDLAPVGLKSTS